MAILSQDLTFQLDTTGVTLNTDSVGLPFVDIDEVVGFDSGPFRETQREHEGQDGGFMDAEFLSGKDVILNGTIYTDGTNMETFLDSLKYNFRPRTTTIPFYFKPPGKNERVIYVKPRGVVYNWNQLRRTGCAAAQFRMYAEDPRTYASAVQSTLVAVGSTIVPGRSYNKHYNFGYGGTTVIPDGATLTNGGNKDAPLTVTMVGPLTNPQLVSDTAGKTINFAITLLNTDTLVVDMLRHTIVLNGSANRRGIIDNPNWFFLAPGDNIVRFRAQSGTGTATYKWQDTYW